MMLPQTALFDRADPVAPPILTALPSPTALRDVPGTISCEGIGTAPSLDTALALTLFRHMIQPAILMDPDGRVTLVNAAAARLIMPPPPAGGPQGRFWWELWPHADRAELHAALALAAAGETASFTLDCRRAVASTGILAPLGSCGQGVEKLLCMLRAH